VTGDVLGDLDATGVAEAIRGKQFTAAEAVDAAVARIQKLQPQLNFMVTDLFARAREDAAKAPGAGAFAGVPTLIKDLLDVTGAPTRFGCRAFAGAPAAAAQSKYADAIFASGLIALGKSTTPEFGFTATTEPLLTGPTRNPWNTEYSTGGSSGGAAAAVASGAVPIAHASDGGGSIRIPASCCGLVGLKPSRGRHIDDGRDQGPVPISVNGAVTRTVRDTAAYLVATQRTGDDKVYAPVEMITGPSTRRLKIGLQIKTMVGKDPDPEVAAEAAAWGEALKVLGHDVRPFTVPVDGAAFTDAFMLLWASSALEMRELVTRLAPVKPIDQLLEPLSLQLADIAQKRGPAALGRAIGTLKGSQVRYESIFPGIDVLLTPTLAKAPPRIGDLAPTQPPEAFQKVIDYVGYTPLINAVGAPAISLPLSWTSGGLPIGAHFCARAGDEATLLALAYELEEVRPWKDRKPPVHA
jgi:amidase